MTSAQSLIAKAIQELEDADTSLLGRPGCGLAMNSIRRAVHHLLLAQTHTNENAPLERGA